MARLKGPYMLNKIIHIDFTMVKTFNNYFLEQEILNYHYKPKQNYICTQN